MSSDEIIFYDLPSRGTPKCWSLNPWKARLALNFKNVPYKTEWVEYPDVAPTFKSFDIPPNSPSLNPNAQYSIPAIKLPGNKYIMDSLAIAQELERLYPEPSLKFANNDYAPRMQTAVAGFWSSLQPIAVPRVPELILNPKSAEYFNTTRATRFGMPLTELAKSERAGEQAWKAAEQAMDLIVALLEENEGKYVQGGDEPSFADFILAGVFRFSEIVDKEGDLFGRVMGYHGALKEHYEACKPWLKRDD
ncbi:hypothetical protein CERZMDRAFT_34457 [Cercospora zeae-maydis SCOH1-5]|uniref:GST N-terminal domain-containing protein n=1 Tax=Cercospora zeae-maydis SCOH1-5 TaxID=717836 RepID=A0A6A6FQI0_9PEZI|nr:hypothetical protein CERZMDRAFT_34457 [Cercospora zeae-maydis SCOH1-5]